MDGRHAADLAANSGETRNCRIKPKRRGAWRGRNDVGQGGTEHQDSGRGANRPHGSRTAAPRHWCPRTTLCAATPRRCQAARPRSRTETATFAYANARWAATVATAQRLAATPRHGMPRHKTAGIAALCRSSSEQVSRHYPGTTTTQVVQGSPRIRPEKRRVHEAMLDCSRRVRRVTSV